MIRLISHWQLASSGNNSGLPIFHNERRGENDWNIEDYHYIHGFGHRRLSGQCSVSAVPARGGPRRLSLWNAGLFHRPDNQRVEILGTTNQTVIEDDWRGYSAFHNWSLAVGRQLRPYLGLHHWLPLIGGTHS